MLWSLEVSTWIWILSTLSGLMFVASLVIIPILIVRLPEDYFIRQPIRDWPTRHPLVHLFLIVSKNLVGLGLVAAGITMLVLPGQGLLTILIGLLMIDFPGKRRLEGRLIQVKPVREAANWMRQRRGHKPFVFEP